METNGVIEVKARTWEKDSHDLFDYESRSTENFRFLLRGSAKICRKNLEIEVIPEDAVVPEGYDVLAGIHITDTGILQFTPLFTKRSRTWLVVKELSNSSYTIIQGDTINLGRFRLKVKQIVSDPNSRSDLCLTDSKSPVFIEPPNPEQYQCRICLSEGGEPDDPLVAPCVCKGSIEYIHISCLKHWMLMKNTQYNAAARASQTSNSPNLEDEANPLSYNYFRPIACELCHAVFPHGMKVLPYSQKNCEQASFINDPAEEPETATGDDDMMMTFEDDCDFDLTKKERNCNNKQKKSKITTFVDQKAKNDTDQDKELSLIDVPDVKPPFLILQNDAGSTITEHFQQIVNRQPIQPLLKALHIISTSEGHRKQVKFGRGHEADVRVPDVSISRLHASIDFEEEKVFLDEETGEEVPEYVAINAAAEAVMKGKLRTSAAVGDASTRLTIDDDKDGEQQENGDFNTNHNINSGYYRNSIVQPVNFDDLHMDAFVQEENEPVSRNSSLEPISTQSNDFVENNANNNTINQSINEDIGVTSAQIGLEVDEDDRLRHENMEASEFKSHENDSDRRNSVNAFQNTKLKSVENSNDFLEQDDDEECAMQKSQYSEGGASTADGAMPTKRSYRCEIRRRLVLRDNSSKFGTLVSIQKPLSVVMSKISEDDVPNASKNYVKSLALGEKVVSLPARFSELPSNSTHAERLANQPVVTSKIAIQVGRSVLTFEVPSLDDESVLQVFNQEGILRSCNNSTTYSASSRSDSNEQPHSFIRKIPFGSSTKEKENDKQSAVESSSPVLNNASADVLQQQQHLAFLQASEELSGSMGISLNRTGILLEDQNQNTGQYMAGGLIVNTLSNNNGVRPLASISASENRRTFSQFLHGLQSAAVQGFAPFFNVFGAPSQNQQQQLHQQQLQLPQQQLQQQQQQHVETITSRNHHNSSNDEAYSFTTVARGGISHTNFNRNVQNAMTHGNTGSEVHNYDDMDAPEYGEVFNELAAENDIFNDLNEDDIIIPASSGPNTESNDGHSRDARL